MKPLELTVNELLEFKANEKMLYAKDGNRAMYINLHGNFEVWINDEKAFEHMQPFPAVEYFNNH